MGNVYFVRIGMVIAALAGVVLFKTLGMPLPWLLGPMTSTVILKLKYPAQVVCPLKLRNLFLIPLGYGIGAHVTLEACHEIFNQLTGITLATFIAIIISVGLAWFTSRTTGVSIASSTIGNMPGGLTPMILICEKIKEADVGVVVVLQSLRLMGTIFAIPFLLEHGLGSVNGGAVSTAGLILPTVFVDAPLWLLLLVPTLGAFVAHKIRMPADFLLGPILSAGALSIYLGGNLLPPPEWLTAISQIVTGIYLGTCIDPFELGKNRKLFPVAFIGMIGMIVGCLFIGYVLSTVYGFSLTTAFLATAPGGIAEMCITGMVLGENVAVILAYQLFRLMFLSFVMPVFLQWYFTREAEKRA